MISLEWVKDYIDISDQDLKELARKITESGINVEKVITNHMDNLVIGEVLECVDHPDSRSRYPHRRHPRHGVRRLRLHQRHHGAPPLGCFGDSFRPQAPSGRAAVHPLRGLPGGLRPSGHPHHGRRRSDRRGDELGAEDARVSGGVVPEAGSQDGSPPAQAGCDRRRGRRQSPQKLSFRRLRGH